MARPIIRAATGIVLPKRLLLHDFLIPDVTSVDFDNPVEFDILSCNEGQDENIESTGGTTAGTDVAQIPLYSRLLSFKTNLMFRAANACMVRWMLVKNDDNDFSAGNFNSAFHSSNDDATTKAIHKLTMAKGFVNIPSDKLAAPLRIFVKRSAMKRVSPMKEDDKISMVFSKEAAGTTATLSGFGTFYVKANG